MVILELLNYRASLMDENSRFGCKIGHKKSVRTVHIGMKLCVRLCLLIACQVAVIDLPKQANAQSLSQVRDASRTVSPAAPQPPPEKKSRSHHDHQRHDDCDDGGNIVGDLIGAILFAPFTGNSQSSLSSGSSNLTSSNDINYEIYSSDESQFSFLKYPYADQQFGIGADSLPSGGNPLKSQLAFWYGTDFDDIDSWNTQYRLESAGFYGFEFQWSHLTEKLTGVRRDSLNLADFNVTMRWIESPEWVLRTGIGVNLLVDRFGTEADYNLTLSSDFFPVKPCIISFELDHGEIGSTHQTHLLSTIGLNYKRAEILTGYEYRKIGRTEIQGPLLGMRLWW